MLKTDILPLDTEGWDVVGIERLTVAGRDASGLPVESWSLIYSGLLAVLDPHSQGEHMEFEQRVLDFRYLCYFAPLNPSVPGLPDIRIRDRILAGNWPDGSVKYLDVIDVLDELEAGVIMPVVAVARKPG